ncbi:MAG: hypothetical protein M1818_005526 [Claussenomyces sp. TS43310]|nr:MAG: hypothetical protein M1818_005526 [Claussenomyces sp. TS43310]
MRSTLLILGAAAAVTGLSVRDTSCNALEYAGICCPGSIVDDVCCVGDPNESVVTINGPSTCSAGTPVSLDLLNFSQSVSAVMAGWSSTAAITAATTAKAPLNARATTSTWVAPTTITTHSTIAPSTSSKTSATPSATHHSDASAFMAGRGCGLAAVGLAAVQFGLAMC